MESQWLCRLCPTECRGHWILGEQWSHPGQAVEDGALLSVLLSFCSLAAQQKQLLGHPNTRKNPMSVQIPSLGGKTVSKSAEVPPAAGSWGSGMGMD